MEKWTKEERKAIGSRIQRLRKKKGLLQEDLANEIGLKVGTISKYEQGDRTPGIRQLYRISEILGCDISELITGNPGNPGQNQIQNHFVSNHAETTEQSDTQPSHKPDEAIRQTDIPQNVPSSPCEADDSIQSDLSQKEPESSPLTESDAFIQWLNLSSIQVTAESEGSYLIQIGSRTFPLSEKEFTRIMGFLKKQFLKILLQMTRKE